MRDKALAIFRDKLSELERHNPWRKGHGERVASHAVATAHKLGFDDEQLFAIRIASALHDYGKLRIAVDVLESPDAIETSQLVEIRGWVVGVGAELAREVGIEAIDSCISCQYERFDGLGFPGTSKGKRLPVAAQTIAVCTAFDVMTHIQPWKRAKSEEDALAELNRNSGTQFDPAVVAAFSLVQPLITPVEL